LLVVEDDAARQDKDLYEFIHTIGRTSSCNTPGLTEYSLSRKPHKNFGAFVRFSRWKKISLASFSQWWHHLSDATTVFHDCQISRNHHQFINAHLIASARRSG
jgi:hypothetical protein